MDVINFELLRAGTNAGDSDSGSEVARKFNDNFAKVNTAFAELEDIKFLVRANTIADFPAIGDTDTIYLATSEGNGDGVFYWWDLVSSTYKTPTVTTDFDVIHGGKA